jgi:C-terminal processing protease CtpA/Prc
MLPRFQAQAVPPDDEHTDTRSQRTLEYDIQFQEALLDNIGLEFDSDEESASTIVKVVTSSFDGSLRRTRPAVGDIIIAINGESVV